MRRTWSNALWSVLVAPAIGCAQLPPPPPPIPVAPAEEARGDAKAEPAFDPLAILSRGAWTARDPDSAWYLRYRFRDDRYTTAGHPTWDESGRLEVVRVRGRRVVLRFVDRIFDGHEDEPLEEELVIDEDGEGFVMAGRRFVHEPAVRVAATAEGDAEPAD